jgi:hypothetical protein
VDLYQHQLASVYQMEKLEREQMVIYNGCNINTSIGCNADETGYGKTLSMITLIHRDKMNWDINSLYEQTFTTSYANGRIKKTKTQMYEKLDVTLVLVSNSIIRQWYDEIHKTPLCVTMITTKKQIDTTTVNNYDIVLVTPTMYNNLVCKHIDMAWKRFVYDEPGHMRVPAMKKIVAGFIWLVTATPDAIVYKHRNCRKSFMYDIIGDFGWCSFSETFDYLIVKNSLEFIQQSFSMPPTKHFYYKCHNPLYNIINTLVSPKINEMVSAGNIYGAIRALGGSGTNNIVEIINQKKIDELKILNLQLNILVTRNKHKQIALIKQKIGRVETQINNLKQKYNDMLCSNCPICFDPIKNPVMESSCQNIFCGKCLFAWFDTKTNCPLCRKSINVEELLYIHNEKHNEKHQRPTITKLNTKVETVTHLLTTNPKGKFIIFSAWDETFTPIRNLLVEKSIKYIEINGSIETRTKNLQKYKNGDINVVFLNSRNNGTGINLQESTDIIVYHKMSNSTLNQLIGRANRIGRTAPLNIHHLQI